MAGAAAQVAGAEGALAALLLERRKALELRCAQVARLLEDASTPPPHTHAPASALGASAARAEREPPAQVSPTAYAPPGEVLLTRQPEGLLLRPEGARLAEHVALAQCLRTPVSALSSACQAQATVPGGSPFSSPQSPAPPTSAPPALIAAPPTLPDAVGQPSARPRSQTSTLSSRAADPPEQQVGSLGVGGTGQARSKEPLRTGVDNRPSSYPPKEPLRTGEDNRSSSYPRCDGRRSMSADGGGPIYHEPSSPSSAWAAARGSGIAEGAGAGVGAPVATVAEAIEAAALSMLEGIGERVNELARLATGADPAASARTLVVAAPEHSMVARTTLCTAALMTGSGTVHERPDRSRERGIGDRVGDMCMGERAFTRRLHAAAEVVCSKLDELGRVHAQRRGEMRDGYQRMVTQLQRKHAAALREAEAAVAREAAARASLEQEREVARAVAPLAAELKLAEREMAKLRMELEAEVRQAQLLRDERECAIEQLHRAERQAKDSMEYLEWRLRQELSAEANQARMELEFEAFRQRSVLEADIKRLEAECESLREYQRSCGHERGSSACGEGSSALPSNEEGGGLLASATASEAEAPNEIEQIRTRSLSVSPPRTSSIEKPLRPRAASLGQSSFDTCSRESTEGAEREWGEGVPLENERHCHSSIEKPLRPRAASLGQSSFDACSRESTEGAEREWGEGVPLENECHGPREPLRRDGEQLCSCAGGEQHGSTVIALATDLHALPPQGVDVPLRRATDCECTLESSKAMNREPSCGEVCACAHPLSPLVGMETTSVNQSISPKPPHGTEVMSIASLCDSMVESGVLMSNTATPAIVGPCSCVFVEATAVCRPGDQVSGMEPTIDAQADASNPIFGIASDYEAGSNGLSLTPGGDGGCIGCDMGNARSPALPDAGEYLTMASAARLCTPPVISELASPGHGQVLDECSAEACGGPLSCRLGQLLNSSSGIVASTISCCPHSVQGRLDSAQHCLDLPSSQLTSTWADEPAIRAALEQFRAASLEPLACLSQPDAFDEFPRILAPQPTASLPQPIVQPPKTTSLPTPTAHEPLIEASTMGSVVHPRSTCISLPIGSRAHRPQNATDSLDSSRNPSDLRGWANTLTSDIQGWSAGGGRGYADLLEEYILNVRQGQTGGR